MKSVRVRRRVGQRLNTTGEQTTLVTSNQEPSEQPSRARVEEIQEERRPLIVAPAIVEDNDIPFKVAIKKPKTWIVTFCCCVSLIQGIFVSFVFKSYGLENIPDDAFITTVGTIGALCNGLSRSFWANLIDRFSYKIVFSALLILQIVIGFTIDLIKEYKILYLLWVAMSFFTLGGYFSMTPTICAKMYGNKTGGQVYSVVFIFFVPAGIV